MAKKKKKEEPVVDVPVPPPVHERWDDVIITAWHEDRHPAEHLHTALGMSPSLYARYLHRTPQWAIGIDEVGRGAIAGPLTIAGVLAPWDWWRDDVKDSKKMTPKARARVAGEIARTPQLRFFIYRASSSAIDQSGLPAMLLDGFRQVALAALVVQPDAFVVLDGDIPIPGIDHILLPKADDFVPSVSAASIMAKVDRDGEMAGHDALYGKYGFAVHKGYDVPSHRAALMEHGPCPLHRRSVRTVQTVLRHTSPSSL